MTKKRKDKHSTEFGLWLREHPGIDSRLGYVTSNIDYAWRSNKTEEWMLIEEKRYKSETKEWQRKVFKAIDESICDDRYKGFYLLTFENTDPDDGEMTLGKLEGMFFPNIRIIGKDQLISFLRFEWTP